MVRAWMVLLAACGYPPLEPSSTCWELQDATHGIDWSACTAAALPDAVDMTASASIDTGLGASTMPGLSCSMIALGGASGTAEVCAVLASSIRIEAGATLSAHGPRPLALLAHAIDIEGTVDVASHAGGLPGAGVAVACAPSATLATLCGGGAGGAFGAQGGKGGDAAGASGSGTGGARGNTVAATVLRGGCDGRRGGDGTASGGADGAGGAGGGAVWIASDMGMLVVGSAAVINASGASGAGGATGHGGGGGGSGGMIVLQSTTIMRQATAEIFANGGHGGGGGCESAGTDGIDPDAPSSTGQGGAGANGGPASDGGGGYPAAKLDGNNGDSGDNGCGGGGGGGAGVVAVASDTPIDDANVSPPPVRWNP